MNSDQNIDQIMKLLKIKLIQNPTPLVSRSQWDDIPKTPYTVLISCLLSLRTKDEITEKASIHLLKKYPTARHIDKLSEKQIQELIYPVGFYKIKAKRIKNISKTLIQKYNGEVPNDINILLSLKGVGRKTANIVMVYGFNKTNYLPIDTHCHRIPNRLGWIKTKTPDETEIQLRKILPKKYWIEFNHLFVVFGQTICKPISPHCSICPLTQYCKKIKVSHHR